MDARLRHDWLDEGSLYILLPERLVPLWGGIDTLDYAHACAISDDWLTRIRVGDGFGFLLGGDPGMTLVVPGPGSAATLIRWIYADHEEELIAFALRGSDVQRTEPTVTFENSAATWVLFHSAANWGDDKPAARRFSLPLGRVQVTTTYLQSDRNAAIVHRFATDL